MASYLLDTSIIVDFLNGKRGRGPLLSGIAAQGHTLCCCAVNVAEVYAGMHPEEAKLTDRLLHSLEYYEITREVACRAGRLRYDWARKGKTLSLADVLIAAVALTFDLTLMTDNLKHYPMRELKIYDLS